MKLNKIASAIAIVGFGLCSAAWSQVIDPTLVLPNQPNASTASTTAPLAAPALTTAVAPVTNPVLTTRIDAPKADGSQATNAFSTPTYDLGNSTNPIQSTVGGPGGVSGLGVAYTVTTANVAVSSTPVVGSTISAGTAYVGGAKLGGVTYATSGTLTVDVTALAGDKLLQAGTGTSGPVSKTVGGGLAGTDHDFTKASGNTATVGLCTYCHTPHKASSTLLLWNKTMSNNNFKWDVASTTAGTKLPGFAGKTYGGPSAKCLACHDGSVAIGDIGWFAGAGRTGTGAALNANTMLNIASTSSRFVMGNDGQLGAGSAWVPPAVGNFGGSAVHPVAIPYPLNGAPNVYNGSTTGARLATNDFVPDPTANNIRLYSDVGGGIIVGKVEAGKTGIECSSCHDVHNKAATDKYFLRGKMVGSSLADGYICAQCHTK